MKLYLLRIVLFFTIVVVVDLALGCLGDYFQAHAKGGATRQFDDLVSKSYHDVLILGSSRAHHHYDTPFLSDILGFDVYNAGYDGNGVVLAYGILEMILERYQPKLVLFDVEPAFDIEAYPNDNNHIRYIELLRPYYRYPAVDAVIKDVSFKEWCKVRSGLIRYNSKMISMMVDCHRSGGIEPQGYKPLFGRYAQHKNIKGGTDKVQLDTFKLAYIENLILSAQQYDIPIILLASPKLGASNSDVMKPIADICDKYGVTFLNYYTAAEYQHPDFFKEPMHLNVDGARVYSKEIVNVIRNRLQIN